MIVPASGPLLLLAAIGWPIALATLWLLPAFRRIGATLAATMALPALLLAFTGDTTLLLRAPGLFTSMQLGVDPVGRPFLLLTTLLWSVVGIHAHAYMKSDARRTAFTGFMLATGTGNIGLTLAQDTLSFYLFFAVMTFAAYGLIVHARSGEAIRAGRVYIAMAVVGEALLLGGLLALTAFAVDTSFAEVPAAFAALDRPGAVAALLLFGFGVKAGMVPLHLWLPLAHPVAPTPASALLSGAMIKAGVLGWLRFLPLGELELAGLGGVTMGAGVIAMLGAAAIGVTQRDPKTVLAYSSISQMGFLTTGLGAAMLLPAAAPMLILAIAVYALHHAPAKAALFLGVGLLRRRSRRFLLLLAAVPALVLAGAPLSSGAIAKAALKNALGDVPPPWPVPIDALLSVAAIGTTLLMARYLALIAAAARAAHARPARGLLPPWIVLIAASAAAAIWLPYALAPLGELPLATSPAYIAAGLWPIVLGVLLAVTAVWLRRRYPMLTIGAVPAGDIVALIEHAARVGARSVRPLRDMRADEAWNRAWVAVEKTAGRGIDSGVRLVDAMAAGPALGVVFWLLAAALFLALR
jgi:formate hydrogenlyase subunit 3/multisubunit Na+/H+ antiporter MnhD subunit